MDLNYQYSESTVRPDTLEVCFNTVYLRKDIVETKREDEQGNVTTFWTYQEAKLTVDEFNKHANAMLVSGQKIGDDNNLAIMEAIADLYEIVAPIA